MLMFGKHDAAEIHEPVIADETLLIRVQTSSMRSIMSSV